jgi:hypothetical protein
MHTHLLVLFAIAAFFVLRGNKEGWAPFAWYGYPGPTAGTVGYQAGGNWCGVDSATRDAPKPIPIVPAQACKAR